PEPAPADDLHGRLRAALAGDPLARQGRLGDRLGAVGGAGPGVLQRGRPGGVAGGRHHVAAGVDEPARRHHEEQEGDEDRHDQHQLGRGRPAVAVARRAGTAAGRARHGPPPGTSPAGRDRSTGVSAVSFTLMPRSTPGMVTTWETWPDTVIRTWSPPLA